MGLHSFFLVQVVFHLIETPVAVPVEFDSIFILARLSPTVGSGSAEYYRIEMKNSRDETWDVFAAGRIGPLFNVNTTVTGLAPGVRYDVRVVLIDDGNCFNEEDAPVVSVLTNCVVPPPSSLNLTGKQMLGPYGNWIRLSWKRVEGKNWCPVEHFNVELTWASGESQAANVSASEDNTSDFFSKHWRDRNNGAHARIRGITSAGPMAFSPRVYVKPTVDIAWGLRARNINTRSFQLEWEFDNTTSDSSDIDLRVFREHSSS